MKILFIIAVIVIISLIILSPVIINAHRDYSNLHAGSRVYVRIRDDIENSPYNYRDAIVVIDRPLYKKESLAYSDGLVLHHFSFWDILTLKVITEERYDTIFD